MTTASFFLSFFLSFFHLHEQHAVWLEHLFELNNFDTSNHWSVRVMYFYSPGNPANVRRISV